ncbi:Apoptosis-associated speck-like protein containing a CARD [Anabarilius grahami]|uniref:Apoptosis-associated speck-like protein containing a CARD n=1 Tax=Anabarilius grahami TaxID=495550 RepID=A0A3N0Z0B8_ANAGA|nr:Apoptosis-associated speck-like protein containing a CARD [Anabarilius grahami]
MASVEEQLLKALEELGRDKLDKFKWFLKKNGSISTSDMEKADAATGTVDVMVERFEPDGAVKITLDILGKMKENHLAKQLENWTATTEKNEPINPKKDEPRLNSEAHKAQLFNKHWPDLIQRVKNVKIIADKLLAQEIIHEEQYSEITHDRLTSAESMRKICDIIRKHSDTVKAKFISILQEVDRYLLEDLS